MPGLFVPARDVLPEEQLLSDDLEPERQFCVYGAAGKPWIRLWKWVWLWLWERVREWVWMYVLDYGHGYADCSGYATLVVSWM